MVKKVIDIIPPEKLPAREQAAEENFIVQPIQLSQFVPPAQAAEETASEFFAGNEEKPEAKPRITYSPHKIEATGSGAFAKPGKGGFFKGLLLKLAIVAAIVGLAMYGLDLKFAKAVVKIWPATSMVAEQTKVIVDSAAKSVDIAKSTVPGLVIAVDSTIKGEAPVTTMKDSKGKAQGTVKIFNNYTAAQRLVKGTRLQAPLEKFQPALAKDEAPWYRTAEEVVIEPKSSATVKVAADGSGEKYNIDPSVFSVPGLVGTAQYTYIYAQSFEKFVGGTQGNFPEVGQSDIDNAKTFIAAQADADIKKELASKVPEGFIMLESTVKITLSDTVVSAKIGDPLAKIPCQVQGKAIAIAYKKSDVDELGEDFILNKIPVGSIVDDPSLKVVSSDGNTDPVSGKPSALLNAEVRVYQGMNDSDLKKGLSEKSKTEALLFLTEMKDAEGNNAMKDVKIQLSPPWRMNIPRELDKIEVQTNFE